jgi:hypothetical protein
LFRTPERRREANAPVGSGDLFVWYRVGQNLQCSKLKTFSHATLAVSENRKKKNIDYEVAAQIEFIRISKFAGRPRIR